MEEKLRFTEQKLREVRASDAAAEDDCEEELFRVFQQVFDEVIERLPVFGPLLAQVKQEYEGVVHRLVRGREENEALAERLHVKSTETGTISNYRHRVQELEGRMASVRADNTRIKEEMERMRKEREAAVSEREHRAKQLRHQKPRMTSARRRGLRLTIQEATSITQLQRQLLKAKLELEEAREVTQKKYVPLRKKLTIQNHLKEKEELRKQIAAQNQTLAILLQRLQESTEAGRAYAELVKSHQLDPDETDVTDYILANIGKSAEDVRSLSDEEAEDPLKEKEAEMILDCFEKFNELFENERYEEAALHAATSPKGILRTLETLQQFQSSARHQPGQRPPLLGYCEALMQSTGAYRPVTSAEALECVRCALEQGEVAKLTHWIAQGALPSSEELGSLISQHCKCKERCRCGCQNVAFAVFRNCSALQQAALCLVHQGRFVSFLAFAKKARFSTEEFASILHSLPSLELARCLVMPPSPYLPHMTVFEAMYLLLRAQASVPAERLLEDYLKQKKLSSTQAVMADTK